MKPTQPTLIPMPFAQNGNKNTIPENGTEGKGDASFALGFPQITETPLSIGGLPPSRKDFNGIFNLLSMFAFFGQSGGKFSWSNKLNYMPPAVIYHNGVLWWCVKENGTDTVVKEPGTDNAYWVTLVEYLHKNAKTLGLKVGGGGVPIGTIIIWGYAKNPSEDYGVWLDCDGRNVSNYPNLVAAIGSTTIPDYRGLFLRCQGSQTVAKTVHSSPAVGTKQGDAIRNITGSFSADDSMVGEHVNSVTPKGAFKKGAHLSFDIHSSGGGNGCRLEFDASNVVPTADENRPVNATVRFLIKADD
nr:MAG TPA: tail fiber protein [Caudoviricetes sp.]